jgi:hypothetical protein
VLFLSDKCEAPPAQLKEVGEEVETLLEGNKELNVDDSRSSEDSRLSQTKPKRSKLSRYCGPLAPFTRLFTDISPETRSVMYKLWFLLMGKFTSQNDVSC